MSKFKFFSSSPDKIDLDMAIFCSQYNNPDFTEMDVCFDSVPSRQGNDTTNSEIHIFEEKLRVPKFEKLILRPRLFELLEGSFNQFGATLISGRSGTGKTALATGFAQRYQEVSWYSVQTPESDWNIFSKYFAACISGSTASLLHEPELPDGEQNLKQIAFLTEQIVAQSDEDDKSKVRLIVLDSAHHLFDSDWFSTFFYSLVGALDRNTHLLMLCRGTPSLPLWRLRSKQVLRVLDEKVLNFNLEETRELIGAFGIPLNAADSIHGKSFGRVSRIMEFIEKYSVK